VREVIDGELRFDIVFAWCVVPNTHDGRVCDEGVDLDVQVCDL